MSTQVETAFVNQYNANVQLLSQQPNSRLEMAVRRETQQGEYQFFDQIGAVAVAELSSRHADTSLSNTPHARRRVGLVAYVFADMVDWKDRAQMLTDPASPYAVNAVMSMARKKDEVIIAAATGDAYTDKTGSTTTALPSSQKVVHGSAGLTIAKLREAKKILDINEASSMGDDERYIAVSAKQIDDLLGTTEVTSADYNTVKALVQGDIDTFMGFKFIRTELLDLTTSIRTCFAWCKNGILLSTAKDITVEVERRADKNYGVQVYVSQQLGATRMEEKKVVEVQCHE